MTTTALAAPAASPPSDSRSHMHESEENGIYMCLKEFMSESSVEAGRAKGERKKGDQGLIMRRPCSWLWISFHQKWMHPIIGE